MAEEPFVVEFPPDTLALIDKLAQRLKIDRVHVVAKGLGLLELWVDAREEGRLIVERPRSGFSGQEYEIDIADNPPS